MTVCHISVGFGLFMVFLPLEILASSNIAVFVNI